MEYISRADVTLLRRFARRNEDHPMAAAETRLCTLLISGMSRQQNAAILKTCCKPGKDTLSSGHLLAMADFMAPEARLINGPQGRLP